MSFELLGELEVLSRFQVRLRQMTPQCSEHIEISIRARYDLPKQALSINFAIWGVSEVGKKTHQTSWRIYESTA